MFELKLVAFRPKFSWDSYVKFQEKTISGEFFRIFVQIKAILYQNLWNLSLLSAILFKVRFALKKFTQGLSYVVCTKVRRHDHKQITNRRYREEKLGRFFFRKTCFIRSQSGTYYALLPGYFGLKFLLDIRHCVYWVLGEIWASNRSHKICSIFFVHHCQGWKEGSFVCELLDFFRRWTLIR